MCYLGDDVLELYMCYLGDDTLSNSNFINKFLIHYRSYFVVVFTQTTPSKNPQVFLCCKIFPNFKSSATFSAVLNIEGSDLISMTRSCY